MFEKLLAVLPYNPSLVHQMKFYGRRMHEEAAIRRIGLIFMVLTFMVQFFAVLSPPKPTAAATNSSNDMVSGGVSSASDAKSKCVNNVRGYKKIMAHYDITCNAIGKGEVVTLHSGAANGQYYSMGHDPKGARNPTTGKVTNETPANIPGAGTLYFRLLKSFDSGGSSPYTALKVHDAAGNKYFILFSCGNLVSVGLPSKTAVFKKEPSPPPTGWGTLGPPPTPPPPATPPPPPPTPCPYNPSLPANSPLCYEPCKYNPLLPANDPNCKPCEKSAGSTDAIACIAVRKTASNVTAGISDANDTTANAGDVITYTIYAQNNSKADIKDFVFQENLNDVLDYADITDLYGGTMNAGQIVSWPAEEIKAGATASHQITIKVKDPIPQTPASPSDPSHFDLVMTNVYGNAVNIKLPGSPSKTVETAAATLPNTGPGTSLLMISTIVIAAGYFYSRARLLSRESELAVKETNYA